MALSKRKRFEVFKRDRFTCSYCGRTPPAVVLEVDHVIPICNGGTDETHNLATSCFDCNRGKSGIGLDVIPQTVEERIAIAAEKADQVKRFERLLRAEKNRVDKETMRLAEYWCNVLASPDDRGKYVVSAPWQKSIKTFLGKLTATEIESAMDVAQGKADTIRSEHARLKYFCGICWSKIRQLEGGNDKRIP